MQSAQSTASDLGNKASENAPSSGEAQGTAQSYLQKAQDTATNLANQAYDTAPSSGEAQETGKSYLESAQKMASDAAKTVSDTVSGESPHLVQPSKGGYSRMSQTSLTRSPSQAPASSKVGM